jgi:hypothetical protein
VTLSQLKSGLGHKADEGHNEKKLKSKTIQKCQQQHHQQSISSCLIR